MEPRAAAADALGAGVAARVLAGAPPHLGLRLPGIRRARRRHHGEQRREQEQRAGHVPQPAHGAEAHGRARDARRARRPRAPKWGVAAAAATGPRRPPG